MKYKGQGKKEYLVLKFDDYDNTWREFSKPVTIGQASKLMLYYPSQKLKMELIKNAKMASH